MLDIKTIREREADVRAMLQFKRSDVNLDAILALDKERRGLLTEVEVLKNQRNVESKKLGEIKRAGDLERHNRLNAFPTVVPKNTSEER